MKEKFLFRWRNKNIKDSAFSMLENIIQQAQKEYEAAHDDKIYDNHQYNIQYIHQNCRFFCHIFFFL